MTPAIGGRSVANVPWPRRRLPRRRGGSAGSTCGTPFFPRVLVHLVGLDGRVAQRVAVEVPAGEFLESMPQAEQVLAVVVQLAGHLRGGSALGEAVEDQQERAGAGLAAVQGGPGPGVEDAATFAASVVQDGVAVAAMDGEPPSLSTPGAGQSVGVEQIEELLVAGGFVEVIHEGEIHGRGPPCKPDVSS
jgi:hypothetical protein